MNASKVTSQSRATGGKVGAPDHDWGQPTQTSVDTGKGYSTSSTGAATTTSADERGKGLGSISTDGGPGETCFTKGTKVKLYKGGTIAIEKLKKGDVILGIYGEPNEVLGMDIHKVANDNRPELVQIEGYKKPTSLLELSLKIFNQRAQVCRKIISKSST